VGRAAGRRRGGRISPAGLGARDTLRLEAALPLYGHELGLDTSPYEARLGWVVQPAKGEFVGRAALLAAKARGPRRRLVGIELVDPAFRAPSIACCATARPSAY
jgi:aminomethyltransferase